jgi:hypothetical protein
MVEPADAQYMLQIFIIVIAVQAFLAFTNTEPVTLLPHTQRMGFDATQVFNITNGKMMHAKGLQVLVYKQGYPLAMKTQPLAGLSLITDSRAACCVNWSKIYFSG